MKCNNCGIEFDGRKDARFCSPKCRVTFSRKQSVVTDNVTLSEPDVTDNFQFYTITKANGLGRKEDEKSKVRTGKYWYDIPLGAIPVRQNGWPEVPTFPAVDDQPETQMNGRQYFLWWKNNFETGESGEPVILNPFPVHDNVRVELGGEGSRRWGA